MKNDHETRVKRSAERIADELPEHIRRWIDREDVAQDIAEARLRNPGHKFGRIARDVQRNLRTKGKRFADPPIVEANTDVRPTETASIPELFWSEVRLALTTPSSPTSSPEIKKSAGTIFGILSLLYRGGSTREEVAQDLKIDLQHVREIHDATVRGFRGRGRVHRFRSFLED